jgi:hypothetical protein
MLLDSRRVNAYKILVGKDLDKWLLIRVRRSWKADIKVNTGGIWRANWKWMELALHNVRWWTMVFMILNLQVLLPES